MKKDAYLHSIIELFTLLISGISSLRTYMYRNEFSLLDREP